MTAKALMSLSLMALLAIASAPLRAQDAYNPYSPFPDSGTKPAKAKPEPVRPPSAESPYLPQMEGPPPLNSDPRGETVAAPPPDAAPGPYAERPAPSGARPADAGKPRVPAPPPRADTVMREAIPPPVDKGELAPVMAADGSGLPFELWRGLDVAGVEKLMSEIEIPPRSPALHSLWKRLITSDVTPPAGETSNQKFAALRLEALYLSGLAKEASGELKKQPVATDALMAALAARNQLAAGETEQGCDIARRATSLKGDIPKRLRGEAILITGYCAALAKDAASAGLAAELGRDEGLPASPGLDALDAISVGAKPKIAPQKRMSLLDYRLMALAGVPAGADVLDKAEPALLVALANDPQTEPVLKLQAAEAAARLNALSPDALAQIYRAVPAGNETADALLANAQATGPARRAALLKFAEAEHTPMKKTRLIRALIDDAQRAQLGFQAMQMSASAANGLNPQPEISWFAETGAIIGLASNNMVMTQRWVTLAAGSVHGPSPLDHWLALADIADPSFSPRGQYLNELETLALHGRFTPDALNRLATVLDALGYNVPIPLWEAASRTPQPTTGHLPPTGVLSELQDSSKKKEFGRTVLLAMKSLGANGAEGAHMIALGDSIRALKRAGLEADARRLGLEALLGSWPRSQLN
jgi:hypothetical protein